MEFSALATLFSGVSFLFFGFSCLVSPYMRDEFIRYGHDGERVMTGWLQMLGGAGLLLGYFFFPPIAAAAAIGLCLMMSYGFWVRMKIGDSLLLSTPAFFYAALNAYLSVVYLGNAI